MGFALIRILHLHTICILSPIAFYDLFLFVLEQFLFFVPTYSDLREIKKSNFILPALHLYILHLTIKVDLICCKGKKTFPLDL